MMSDTIIPLNAWKGRLASSKQGFKKNTTNLMLFLRNLPEFGANIRRNVFTVRPEWNGAPLEETDLVDMKIILDAHDFEPSDRDLLAGVLRHAKDNSYHPVRDYLQALKWDGTPRLDRWMHTCLGAEDTLFVQAAGRRTLIAAVARVMRPGCKVDTVLILEGDQGIKKSSAIKALCGEQWYSGSIDLFGNHQKMVMNMMGKWVIELAEFIAILNRNNDTVKGLLSLEEDTVTLPYAKTSSDHPRQCVFIGSINPGEAGYLPDKTGNRRYWPVAITKADLDLIRARRDQIWAEAYAAFSAGEQWWLTDQEEVLARDQVADREVYDVWDEILEEKLKDYQSTSIGAALQALGVPIDRMETHSEKVAGCLRRIGFKSVPRKAPRQPGETKRPSIRIYVREK